MNYVELWSLIFFYHCFQEEWRFFYLLMGSGNVLFEKGLCHLVSTSITQWLVVFNLSVSILFELAIALSRYASFNWIYLIWDFRKARERDGS